MILDQDKRFYFFLQTIYKAWKLNYNRSLDVVKLSWKLKTDVLFIGSSKV